MLQESGLAFVLFEREVFGTLDEKKGFFYCHSF
jgi:hypothetical protein